ncbi:LolA family protein [Halomonas sp. C05BenzN]|uniref:LolA family protein n=1 Tax=Halomonas sp. C05BenzN TaxID=3411041 RepID=UPI003B92AFD3
MLPELLMVVALGLEPDPLSAALSRFEQVPAYQLTVRSEGRRGEEVIRYTYRRPGFIRMDMVTPYRGAVLIYSPETRRVRLWPFGSPERRAGLSLSPLNPLVRSARGHRVDESDVGTLLRNVQRLQQQGELHHLGGAVVDGRHSQHLVVQGEEGHRVGEVARYELWLDDETLFPLKVISSDRLGSVIETVWLEDIVIDPDLPANVFSP